MDPTPFVLVFVRRYTGQGSFANQSSDSSCVSILTHSSAVEAWSDEVGAALTGGCERGDLAHIESPTV